MNILLGRPLRVVVGSYVHNGKQGLEYIRTKKTFANSVTPSVAADGGSQRKAADIGPKITLIQPNQSIMITTLKEAQKLAKRRDLHLLKQQELDTKTHRPVYKLVTAGEMLSEDVDEVNSAVKAKSVDKKSEKSLTIGSRISDHDLVSRLKHISKWITKNHEVCVLIQGSPEEMANCEKILKAIEQSIKEPQTIGKIVQKRSKGSHIKFNIVPQPPASAVADA